MFVGSGLCISRVIIVVARNVNSDGIRVFASLCHVCIVVCWIGSKLLEDGYRRSCCVLTVAIVCLFIMWYFLDCECMYSVLFACLKLFLQ